MFIHEPGSVVKLNSVINFMSVATKFEMSRRREVPTWPRHEAPAGLPVDNQEKWLDLAEENELSIHALRTAMKVERARELSAWSNRDVL